MTSPLAKMSTISNKILTSVDLHFIKKQRLLNFNQLHSMLGPTNLLAIPDRITFECPMVYPYWTTDKDLRDYLIKERVFVATYWPNVIEWTKSDMIENELAQNCLAIPIDQRYGKGEMNRIIELICNK